MFIIDNYDVEELVSVSEKNDKMSISQVRENIRDICMTDILRFCENIFQNDYGKVVIPIDYNGKINFVELSFTVKKDDFDLKKSIDEFEIRKQNGIKDDLKNNEIKQMKQKIDDIRNSEE